MDCLLFNVIVLIVGFVGGWYIRHKFGVPLK